MLAIASALARGPAITSAGSAGTTYVSENVITDTPRITSRPNKPRRTMYRSSGALPPSLPRVERVTQPVAQQVEPENHQKNHETGEEDQPRGGSIVLLAFLDHRAPRRGGRLHADPEIGQRRLGQDRRRGAQ